MITSIAIRDKCYNFSSDCNLKVDTIEEIEELYNSLMFASGKNLLNLKLKGPGDVLFIKITFSDSTIMDLGFSEEQTYKLIYKHGKPVSKEKEIKLDISTYFSYDFSYQYNEEEEIDYINSVLSLYSEFSHIKLVSLNTIILENTYTMSVNSAGSGYKKSVEYLWRVWRFSQVNSTSKDIVEKIFFLRQCLDGGLDRNLAKILLKATKDLGINLISLSL